MNDSQGNMTDFEIPARLPYKFCFDPVDLCIEIDPDRLRIILVSGNNQRNLAVLGFLFVYLFNLKLLNFDTDK
jgi:hypothetical protein